LTGVAASLPTPPSSSPPSSPSPPQTVQEYHMVCNSSSVMECVPTCNSTTHGYELLATIDGSDTKLICSLAHGLHSWTGDASLGGYIGNDFSAFFSSVVSGAAGTYVSTVSSSPGISTTLSIHPGQIVQIHGDRSLPRAPIWGSGGFTVGERASLSLSYLQIDTIIQTSHGALGLSLDQCVLTFVLSDHELANERKCSVCQPSTSHVPSAAAMELRVSSASFAGVTLRSSIRVPSGEAIHMAGSLSFLDTGQYWTPETSTVQWTNGAGFLNYAQAKPVIVDVVGESFFTRVTARLPPNGLVVVRKGGVAHISDSVLIFGQSHQHWPCDGSGRSCSAPHTGVWTLSPVTIAGALIGTSLPLVCQGSSCRVPMECCGLHYTGQACGNQNRCISCEHNGVQGNAGLHGAVGTGPCHYCGDGGYHAYYCVCDTSC
jgi:hypothetical protein